VAPGVASAASRWRNYSLPSETNKYPTSSLGTVMGSPGPATGDTEVESTSMIVPRHAVPQAWPPSRRHGEPDMNRPALILARRASRDRGSRRSLRPPVTIFDNRAGPSPPSQLCREGSPRAAVNGACWLWRAAALVMRREAACRAGPGAAPPPPAGSAGGRRLTGR